MVKNTIRLAAVLIGLGGALSSCTKFLDQKPNDKVLSEDAISSISKADAALAGCYDGLQDYRYYGRNFIIISEVYSDNAQLGSSNNGLYSTLYNHSTTAYDQEIAGLWTICYQIINRTNEIIAKVPKLADGTSQRKNQIIGEAYALRALVYLDLVRTFAQAYNIQASTGVEGANGDGGHWGVPLVLTPSRADSIISPQRNTVKEVYTQIAADLDSAAIKITIQPANCYSMSAAAVQALKIRRLYSKYENNNVIRQYLKFDADYTSKGICALAPDTASYRKQWTNFATTKDVIFGIPASTTDNNGTNSLGYLLQSTGYVVASNDLYSLFTTDDTRKKLYTKGKDIVVSKYLGTTQGIPILRTSEVFLNFCESFQQYMIANPSYQTEDNRITIIGMLNSLLLQNGRSVQKTTSIVDLHDIILVERQKELAFEGHRLFDIKRRQAAIKRSDCQTTNCSIQFPSPLFAMPIPAAEVNANTNLKQNAGY